MKNLNIIFTGRLSFPNGIASTKRRRYIIDFLNDQNVTCRVLSLRQKDSIRFNNPPSGFYGKTEYVNLSNLFYENYKGKIEYYKNIIYYLKKWYIEQNKNILIFHTSLELELLPVFIYAKKLGYKIIFDQVETSYTLNGNNKKYLSRFYAKCNDIISNWAYKNSDGSFVISKALYDSNRLKFDKPLCLLPNSTPILREKKKEKFSNPIKILYVGTFTPKDGVDYLIDAFKKLQESRNNIKLVLVGTGIKKDMDNIQKKIHDNADITSVGYVSDEDLNNILLSTDILTVTRSNSIFANFGFPFKLSEYLATGNPVLTTKVSDVGIYLTDKLNACLAEPEDVDSIYSNLNYLLESDKRALEIGENGLKVAQQHFNKQTNGKIFIEFLSKQV